MKTPNYWKDKNIYSYLLSPFGWLYQCATLLNMTLKQPQKVDKPVICIGNLTAGGTGKTPVSISFANLLKELGKNPFFVSRGYGGKLHNVVVDENKHSPQEVGDEPLLLARQAPVVVNPNRFEGAKLAIKNGADVIVMDDGFQNPTLKKDLSFLVFDGEFGYGNGMCIPAGPLRESLSSGLKRAQAIIIIGEDKHNLGNKFKDFPVFKGHIVPQISTPEKEPIIAFAGIGRPEKFYTSLRLCGFKVYQTIDFPDHHQYTKDELLSLIEKAKQNKCVLYTTSKDFVKIPAELRNNFKVLEITIQWEDEENLKQFLKKNI